MDSTGNNVLTYRAVKSSAMGSAPATPQRTIAHLAIPADSPSSRRASPRVEDMLRGSPRKAQRTRQRLAWCHSFDDAVALLKRSRNIVILTGAGISTSVGIPDFRSDKGLYSKLSKIGITQPEDFFSMSYFQENPEDFFKYVREVIPSAVAVADGIYKSVKQTSSMGNAVKGTKTAVPKFTPTHAFLALLQAKGKLLTNYTQNIDGLERAAGLPPDQYVQCHGSWDTATCLTCGKKSSAKKYLPVVHSGHVPHCKCLNEAQTVPLKSKPRRERSKTGQKRKRAYSFSDHSSDDGTKAPEPPRSLLKPDLVFFEEKITPLYHTRLDSDRPRIDLLIVIGTSLKVAPIQYMLFKIRPDVPQIYISKERFNGALCSLPGVQVDIELLGECDIIIEELCRRAGWASELERWLWEDGQTKIKAAEHVIKREEQSTQESGHEPLKNPTSTNDIDAKSQGIGDWSTDITTNPYHSKPSQDQHQNEISASGQHPVLSQKEVMEEQNLSSLPISVEESKVKVELVEGTDHQWRITRRK